MSSEENTRPLLDWVLQKYPDTPRSRAKQWILAGRVTLNGLVIRKPHHPLADPGDRLLLLDRHATTLDCGSGWLIHPRVTLLFLDPSLAIVNKGPGLISVPAPNTDLSALSILGDFLAGKLRAADRSIAGKTLPPAYRRLEPLPVHRLDQYTSGVLCIAMNPPSRLHLIEQLKAHSLTREYVAYVQGRSNKMQGTWRHWLQLSPDELRQRVVPEPRSKPKNTAAEPTEAITHFEVLAEYPLPDGKAVVSKLRLRLETGRKHQIRVQAATMGLPLIGDRTYNPDYHLSSHARPPIEFSRQALHAQMINLEHPALPGKRMSWTAALPKDLCKLEAALRH
jgi:23S rRNA pseudouridine1911/1915/1917 synthase